MTIKDVISYLDVHDSMLFDDDADFSNDILGTSIKKLEKVHFKGMARHYITSEYLLEGILTGVMTLTDDVTLEDVIYPFEIEISENLEEYLTNSANTLDINSILWQNIVVEVPLKVRDSEKQINLSGDGWKLLSEEEFESRNNSPLSDLGDLLENARKE